MMPIDRFSDNNHEPGRRPRVLIVQYSSNRDGSTISGLMGADALREAGWETHVAFAFDGAMTEVYRAAGHHVHIAPHKNWLRSQQYIRFAKRHFSEHRSARVFNRLIAQTAPDVVYVNSLVSLAGAVAATRQHLPVVWHLRELFQDVGGEMRAPHWLRWWVRRTVRRNAMTIVANSVSVAENVLAKDACRAKVVYNAVPDAFFDDRIPTHEARAELGLPTDGRFIGVPGTLRPVKGHPFFLRAVYPLAAERTNLRIVVTGNADSEYGQALREMARSFELERQTYFLGSVENMPAFYRACNLVCIPSVAEPFGRTVIEAFAAGVPVIASAVGGIREIVEHDKTGILVPYGDEVALRGAIETLLSSERRRNDLARCARERAYSSYRESAYKTCIRRIVADAVRLPAQLSAKVSSE